MTMRAITNEFTCISYTPSTWNVKTTLNTYGDNATVSAFLTIRKRYENFNEYHASVVFTFTK